VVLAGVHEQLLVAGTQQARTEGYAQQGDAR